MKVLRIAFRVVVVIVVIVAVAAVAAMARGSYLFNRRIARPIPEFHASMDSASVARGRHVAEMRCLGCHSADHRDSTLLSGGYLETFENPLHLDHGTLPYPNLTPGGPLRDWSDGEIARAIREGLDREGRQLIIMPSGQFRNLSDDDLAALLGFLRSQPAVPSQPGVLHLDWFNRLAIGLGVIGISSQPPVTAPVPAVSPDDTLEYGAYLARSLRCGECHGDGLHGNVGPDLHVYAHAYSESLFVRSVQRGRRATDATEVDPFMPWRSFSHLTPAELGVLYRWLRSAS